MYRLTDCASWRHLRRRHLLFVEPDEKAFVALLRATWPEVIFVPHNYVEARTVDPEVKDWTLQSGEPVLRQFDGLSYEARGPLTGMRAWIPEPGWKADWRRIPRAIWHDHGSGWAIVNEPRAFNIEYGDLWARFDPNDSEVRSFVGKVWRLMTRVSTNVVDEVYDDTGAVRTKAVKSPIWFGFHALDWARADPARRLARDCRPEGSSGGPVPREYWMAQHCARPELAKSRAET